jgi:uncharacterized protein YidB (DUF937 family)
MRGSRSWIGDDLDTGPRRPKRANARNIRVGASWKCTEISQQLQSALASGVVIFHEMTQIAERVGVSQMQISRQLAVILAQLRDALDPHTAPPGAAP